MDAQPTSQDQCTPRHVWEAVAAFHPISLDPCSNPWSTVDAFWSIDQRRGGDGLLCAWSEMLQSTDEPHVFVNPPYRLILPWVKKARDESHADRHLHITMLVPVSPETKWSRLAGSCVDARAYWPRRIAFEGLHSSGAKQPSQLLYWGPERYLFCHHFAQFGCEVWCADRRSP